MPRKHRPGAVFAATLTLILASVAVATAAPGDVWSNPTSAPVGAALPAISGTGTDGKAPSIAVSGLNAVAVWRTEAGAPHYSVRVAYSTDGGATWSDPTGVPTGETVPELAAGTYMGDPQVAISGSNAVAVWTKRTTGLGAVDLVQTAFSTDGGVTWSDPTTVPPVDGFTAGTPPNISAAGANAYTPRVAINGLAVVAEWTYDLLGTTYAQAVYSTNGGAAWSKPTSVPGGGGTPYLSDAGSNADKPSLAASDSNAVAVWRRNNVVQVARSSSGGAAWSDPTGVPTGLTAPALSGSGQTIDYVEVAASGSVAVAVWTRNGTVQVARSSDGGDTWTSPTGVPGGMSPPNLSGSSATFAEVAVSGTTAVAVWVRNNTVEVAYSSDGGDTWSGPTTAPDGATAPAISAGGQSITAPEVSVDGSAVIVVWSRSDGTNTLIQTARSNDGGDTWSYPATTSTGASPNLSATGQNATVPQVSLGTDGAVAVWQRSDGSTNLIQAAYSTLAGASSSSSAGASGSPVRQVTFRYLFDDGSTCEPLTPHVVSVNTWVSLPGADAPCARAGAELVGWTIPGRVNAFAPGRLVYVIEDQRFTAVVEYPWVAVNFDANVAATDGCLDAIGANLTSSARTTTWWVPRGAVTAQRLPNAAACTPAGFALVGWSDRRGVAAGTEPPVYGPGEPIPALAVDTDGNEANSITLYARWITTGY